MAELIAELVLGLFCLWSGWRMIQKQDLSTVHKYHYNFVMEQNIPAFSRKLGIGHTIIGMGIIAVPVLDFLFPWDMDLLCLLIIFGGFGYIVFTILKYNGRLF